MLPKLQGGRGEWARCVSRARPPSRHSASKGATWRALRRTAGDGGVAARPPRRRDGPGPRPRVAVAEGSGQRTWLRQPHWRALLPQRHPALFAFSPAAQTGFHFAGVGRARVLGESSLSAYVQQPYQPLGLMLSMLQINK